MGKPVIVVEGVGKQYFIHRHKLGVAQTFGETLALRLKRFCTNENRSDTQARHDFWALKGVSFDVFAGERIGIIGRNGAGKSTLLSILSRITHPTTGQVGIKGRVASLLEVGTGFHPELTGRENIFLNGAILGMAKGEIRNQFDAIVAFAEIEPFVDTPVKHYSSGMYVRLAFAVAIHLESDILMLDEVLAVGDAEFQRKCLEKMSDVTSQGRTTLFVSHNMAAVQHLCSKTAVLEQGALAYIGPTAEAIKRYCAPVEASDGVGGDLSRHTGRPQGVCPTLQGARFVSIDDFRTPITSIHTGESLVIQVEWDVDSAVIDYIQIGIDSSMQVRMATVATHLSTTNRRELFDKGRIYCKIPAIPFVEGRYGVTLTAGRLSPHEIVDCVVNAMTLTIYGGDFYGVGRAVAPELGMVALTSEWCEEPHPPSLSMNGEGANR